MKRIMIGFVLLLQALGAGEPPEVWVRHLKQVETLSQQATQRLETISNANVVRLKQMAAEGKRNSDPTLWLWAERELRVHKHTPFCNLTRPKQLKGYPEELKGWSQSLAGELKTLLTRMKEEKKKTVEEAKADFDAHVRNLVRADDLETARKERDRFGTFRNQKAVKQLEQKIRDLDRLVSGKTHRHLWRRPKNNGAPAPPDAMFLFRPENPAFQAFIKSVSAVSKGSPERGPSYAEIGNKERLAGKRGLRLLALKGDEIVLSENYDTYESKQEGLRLVEDVKSLPYGAFVVLFSHDEATRRFPGETQSTLFRLGATEGMISLPYRSAYLLIGVKGMTPRGAVEHWDEEQLQYP